MFTLATYRQHYDCLSTDIKPTTGINEGSTCKEVDTNREFIFSGTAWVPTEMEGYGATVATRPLATAVPIGFIFEAVTTQEFWQSDGTNWVVC